MKLSTGLDNALLVTGSLKASLNLCFVKVYAGTVPSDADQALGSATHLHTYSAGAGGDAGTGGTFDATPVSGTIVKTVAETWTGVTVGNGTASFARIVLGADDGTLSTTQVRAQLTVGTTGADLLLGNLTYTTSATRTLSGCSIGIPKA